MRGNVAGYSKTPLSKKLGIKEGARVALIGAPDDFESTLGELPDGVTVRRDLRGRGAFDVIVFFTSKATELERRFESVAARLEESGGFWVGWPKKASGVVTDVGEALVRETGLSSGLVDNKICAIDDVWSGLRFVVRVADRKKKR